MHRVPYEQYQEAKWRRADRQTRADYGAPLGDIFSEEDQSPPTPPRTMPLTPVPAHTRDLDVRGLLLRAGISETDATMAIPYGWFFPRTSDPWAQGVQVWVQAIQCGLRKLGYKLSIDGGLGRKTGAALAEVVGPRWYDRVWSQILNAVLAVAPKPTQTGVFKLDTTKLTAWHYAAIGGVAYLLLRGGK